MLSLFIFSSEMRKFLYVLFLGFLIFLAFLFVCEKWVFPNLTKNTYSFKYDYVDQNAENINVLLLGNSYFENSLNPSLLSDCTFDMAVSARWIYYDKELLKKFIPKMRNLKVVIFPVGYHIPFSKSHHYEDNACVDFVHEKYMHVWYDRFPVNIIRSLYVRYGLSTGNRLFSFSVNCDSIGYSPLPGHSSTDWKEDQNINAEIIHNPHAKEQIAEYTEYLKEMAALCQKYNVRFITVTPPCHDSYNANVRDDGMAVIHNMIDGVRTEHPVEYKDYLRDPEFREDSLYYNCSHLNSVGADMFAVRLKQDFIL